MMNGSFQSSYHTHTHYCDGEGRVEDVVEAAIHAGLTEIGISSHAPLPFPTDWTMPPDQLERYVANVRQAQERYRDRITVLLGAELDYIPDARVTDYQQESVFPMGFQYFIGSVHYLGRGYPPRTLDGTEEEFREILHDDYDNDVAAMVDDYFRRVREMLRVPGVRIVGHLDLIKRWNAGHTYFQGNEPWYLAAVDETLAAIAASGHIVELNTAGWRKGLSEPYPAPRILPRCRDLGIPIIINSDSHILQDVIAGFEGAKACLAEAGITPLSHLQ